jgi:hypothetical protein
MHLLSWSFLIVLAVSFPRSSVEALVASRVLLPAACYVSSRP